MELVNVTKKFGENTVLKNINLIFKEQKITSIVGKSGAGKTTLMRMLAGLETETSGEIVIDKKSNIGMVFQDFQLYPHIKTMTNLVLPQRVVLKRSKKEALLRANDILLRLGLDEQKDQYPLSLSGGQRQRLAIARALVMDKNVLLFDEPTSALDQENIDQLISLLLKLKVQGTTIIIITHDQSFAKKVSDEIIQIADGQIVS
jgi:polar amino acid transport system ATP-binding protein